MLVGGQLPSDHDASNVPTFHVSPMLDRLLRGSGVSATFDNSNDWPIAWYVLRTAAPQVHKVVGERILKGKSRCVRHSNNCTRANRYFEENSGAGFRTGKSSCDPLMQVSSTDVVQ